MSMVPAPLFNAPKYEVELGSGQSAGRVGEKINPIYENGQKYTPEQKKTIIAITIVATAAIAATALLIAGCVTGILPLIFVAIPLFLVSLGVGIWYLATKKPDLDSPSTRNQIQNELATQSFNEISQRFDIRDIVGYRLLDGINISDRKRPQFYENIAQLREGHDRVVSEYNRDRNIINYEYYRGTALITNWRNDQELILAQRNALYDASVSPLYYGRHRSRALGTVAAVGSMALHMDAQNRMTDVNITYGMHVRPWEDWRNAENSKINKAYSEAMAEIQMRYDSIKAAAK